MRSWTIACLIALTVFLLGAIAVWGFAEEHLCFRDPASGLETDEEISTIHDDLTYVLALAAGFTISDAQTLEIWNQLVDSEQLGPGEEIVYDNCSGAFYPTPDPRDRAVCARPGNYGEVAWPLMEQVKGPACVTSRFGPYSPFFHFPHQNARELGALHDWGWGLSDKLVGYEAYAWGGKTVMQATCLYTRTAVISTTILAGSLPAFATYLHSLADSYSHRECIAAMDALGMPWATHTLAGCYECNYIPAKPTNDDAHGREFGNAHPSDSQRTDDAIRAVYGELAARSLQREGVFYPLGLDTILEVNGLATLTGLAKLNNSTTLSETLYVFVHNWGFDQPANRRAWLDAVAGAILAQRTPMYRVYSPLLSRP
jgi:hypothetical protein